MKDGCRVVVYEADDKATQQQQQHVENTCNHFQANIQY